MKNNNNIKVDNTLTTETSSDPVREPLKFRKYLYFQQVVLSANYLNGKCVLVSSGNIIHMSKF